MRSRHRCLIYDGSPWVQLPILVAAALDELRANKRCLYLNSAPMVAGFRSQLAAAGLDVEHEVRRGALVLSSDQGHLTDGQFDIDRMLQLLADALALAGQDGFSGLWATGDMLWELGSERNLGKLFAYERALEEMLQQNPGLGGICQYHIDTLPRYARDVALETHQEFCINETIIRLARPDQYKS